MNKFVAFNQISLATKRKKNRIKICFKMLKISLKNFKHSRKFDPASFKLNVQNATIELQDSLET